MLDLVQKGVYPGAKLENPEQPEVVDEADAGDVVQGLGCDGLASGSLEVMLSVG